MLIYSLDRRRELLAGGVLDCGRQRQLAHAALALPLLLLATRRHARTQQDHRIVAWKPTNLTYNWKIEKADTVSDHHEAGVRRSRVFFE